MHARQVKRSYGFKQLLEEFLLPTYVIMSYILWRQVQVHEKLTQAPAAKISRMAGVASEFCIGPLPCVNFFNFSP